MHACRSTLEDPTPLLAAWIVVSALVLGWLFVSRRRLRRNAERWHAALVRGERVLVSPDVGPAAVSAGALGDGVRTGIVLPAWALALDEERLALLLAHEQEHVHSGDPTLLAGALIAAALVPWSPAVWWQLRRLRCAVEIDCDRRVLRRHPDVRAYGRLLLEVANHAVPAPRWVAAALSAPSTSLEQRIRTMTMLRSRHPAQAAALVAIAAGCIVAACEAPRPTEPAPQDKVALSDLASSPNDAYNADFAAGVVPRAAVEQQVRTAIAQHFHDMLTTATGALQHPAFVADSSGHVVLAVRDVTRKRDWIDNPQIRAENISHIDVIKTPAGRIGPDSIAAIWIQLQAARTSAGPEARQALTQMSSGRIYVHGGGFAVVASRALPGSVGDTAGATATRSRISASSAPGSRIRIRGDSTFTETTVTGASGGGFSMNFDANQAHVAGADGKDMPGIRHLRLTWPGGVAPLLFVDGHERVATPTHPDPFSELDSKDIATIKVLNGPAAQARYGDRAVNGVLEVTTKAHAPHP